MHEVEPPAVQRRGQSQRGGRKPRDFAREEEPAQAAVEARPDVSEARDRSGDHRRTRLAEELFRRSGRAVDERLEAVAVERADQAGETDGRSTQLRTVV